MPANTDMLIATVLLLACTTAMLCLAFFRLRRRHRDARHTLNRVASERDELLFRYERKSGSPSWTPGRG